MKEWKCSVCGYVHKGDEPPETCPVCGADRSKFVLLKEAAVQQQPSRTPFIQKQGALEDRPPQTHSDTGAATTKSQESLRAISKLLTRLHAHPIAVHLPNGVLPLTVLFTLMAVLFKSEVMAITAKCNIFFVTLAMPAVILTGFVDWMNRYESKISPVFKVKIVCAALVTALSLVITMWWLVDPDIYLNRSILGALFILLNLIDLGIAAMAGWYGGKLVFPNR